MSEQMALPLENVQVGTGVRYFGNPNPGGNWTGTKVKIFADGSNEYSYRDPDWGKVTVREHPDGGGWIRCEKPAKKQTP